MHDDITDVAGIEVGHDTDLEGGTGCSVVVCAWPAVGGVDVRGGAPATRETDLLDPRCTVAEVHAVVLTGGSAFGLEAASGVMRALEARGVGYAVGDVHVPIIPAAALFDLGLGLADRRPDAAAGARALASARTGPIARGSVGAGTGATVGKLGGPGLAMKGGVGSASAQVDGGFTVGALVVTNALGDVYAAEGGRILAGARAPNGDGWLADATGVAGAGPSGGHVALPVAGANTTIGVVATDAPLSKAEASKLAQMAQDGLARAIAPAHTPFDGDTLFALSLAGAAARAQAPSGVGPLLLARIGAEAARVVARAIEDAVRTARGLHGVPGLGDRGATPA